MTILIPFIGADSTELKYALRSIKEFHPEADFYLVGRKPSWYTGNFIEYKDDPLLREVNIYNKLLLSPANDFVAWFDDHYQLQPAEIKLYNNGSLQDIIAVKNGFYKQLLTRTHNLLASLNKPTLCFDSHTPCWFNLEKLRGISSFMNGRRAPLLKSFYYNYYEIPSTFMPSCKVTLPYTTDELERKELTWLSSDGSSHRGVMGLLSKRFSPV